MFDVGRSKRFYATAIFVDLFSPERSNLAGRSGKARGFIKCNKQGIFSKRQIKEGLRCFKRVAQASSSQFHPHETTRNKKSLLSDGL
jgi:hypothetical protein